MTDYNKIETKLPILPKVAGRYDTDFIDTADKFLNALPSFCETINSLNVDINNAGHSINKIGNEVNELRNETLNYKNRAYSYKEDAISARNEIKSFVIPIEATYNKYDIDVMLNGLLTQIVVQQAQIAILIK